MAAARDVLIKCRPEEINGFIFCVGLQSLDMNCDDLPKFQIGVRSIVSFMRKAALSNESKGELCLRLDPLERLVNMFHTHGATDPRDRVFALLGMSTDLPPTCGLQADYRIDWTTLFLNLVKFMFGKDVQATINRRNDTAMIHTSGHLLGKIVAAGRGTAWGDDQTITLRASNPFRYFTTSADNGDSSSLVRQVLRLTVPSGGKCIAKDDILCYLPSVERVVVLRRQDAAFHIIALFSSLPSHDDWDTDWFQHWSNAMELWMIWGWESVPTYHVARTLTNAREPRNSEIEVSLIATAQILDYLGDYHGAKTAIGAYRLLHPDDPRIATFQDFEKSVQRKASLLSEAQRVLDRLSRHPFELGCLAETLARLHGIPERYDASDSISPWGSINQIQSEFLAQYMVSSNDHELADKVVENYHSAVLSYQVQLGKNPELIERLFCAAIAQPNLHNTTPDRILTLLERYDKPFRDVERMLKIAVRNASMNAEEELIKVISYLLQRAGDNFHVSEDLLAAAAAMETSGIIEIIDLFLDHVHEDCIGSLTVLEVMARNRTQGEKLFTFLDKRYGSKFVVPQYIAQEAMYRGIDMMTALPSKRRTDFFLFPFPSGAVDNFSPR